MVLLSEARDDVLNGRHTFAFKVADRTTQYLRQIKHFSDSTCWLDLRANDNSKQQTANSRQQTANSRQQEADGRRQMHSAFCLLHSFRWWLTKIVAEQHTERDRDTVAHGRKEVEFSHCIK